jgi:hypothetical protein
MEGTERMDEKQKTTLLKNAWKYWKIEVRKEGRQERRKEGRNDRTIRK